MKKLSQHIILSLIVFLLLISFSSCNFLPTSFDFSKQNEVDKAKEKIAKEIPSDALILSIDAFFVAREDQLTSKLNVFEIYYFDATTKELKEIVISGFENNVKDRSDRISMMDQYKIENTVPFSKIDFSKISINIEKGKEILKAADLPFSGIQNYKITVDPTTKEVVHEFELQSRGATNRKFKYGKIVKETEYYTIPFVADATGHVTEVE